MLNGAALLKDSIIFELKPNIIILLRWIMPFLYKEREHYFSTTALWKLDRNCNVKIARQKYFWTFKNTFFFSIKVIRISAKTTKIKFFRILQVKQKTAIIRWVFIPDKRLNFQEQWAWLHFILYCPIFISPILCQPEVTLLLYYADHDCLNFKI